MLTQGTSYQAAQGQSPENSVLSASRIPNARNSKGMFQLQNNTDYLNDPYTNKRSISNKSFQGPGRAPYVS
jgi:hypothetical protein